MGKAVWFLLAVCACGGSDPAGGDASSGGGDGPRGTDGSTHATDGAMADVPGGVGEPSELAGMTLYHNQVRAAVDTTGIAAGPLPPLQWDPALATLAANWVAQCQDSQAPMGLVDHSPTSSRTNVAGYAYVGENIYAGGGPVTAHDAVFGTYGWATEGPYYNYAANTCTGSPTGTCGHYTQVVWRATTHVGCAMHMCAGLTYPYTIVCNYGPGGNIGGQAPY